uniref:DNA ligase n=1 Tax=Marseillevirus LCMAC103 TaxID=2506604 RepID=A0A481YU23_9VIRU|nr:MAG: mRNA capping enzyme [Marseillevirus LCMAC103]
MVEAIRRAVRHEQAREASARRKPGAAHGTAKAIFDGSVPRVAHLLGGHPTAVFEIEGSLGRFESPTHFRPGVASREAFDNILRRLDQADLAKTTSTSTVEVQTPADKRQSDVRKITDTSGGGAATYQRKVRATDSGGKPLVINLVDVGARVRVSRETPLSADAFDEKTAETTMTRWRTRTSYCVPDPPRTMLHKAWHGLRFDLTVVRQVRRGQRDSATIAHEVEVERVADAATAKGLIDALGRLHAWAQNTEHAQLVMLDTERTMAVHAHNQLFGRHNPQNNLDTRHVNHPVSLKIDHLLRASTHKWPVTAKLDGVRKFLLLTAAGTYLLALPASVNRIGAGRPDYDATLIDGEYLVDPATSNPVFFAFDLLFFRGRSLLDAPFAERYGYLANPHFAADIVGGIQARAVDYRVKNFYAGLDVYANVADAFRDQERLGLPTDGLILQSPNAYNNDTTFKWKPARQLTIDFFLLRPAASAGAQPDEYDLMVGAKRDRAPLARCRASAPRGAKNVAFVGSHRHPYSGRVAVPGGAVGGLSVEAAVVECGWDAAARAFYPTRVRSDKPRPNRCDTAESVWDDINRPITEATIRGHTLAVRRRGNNLWKDKMLRDVAAGVRGRGAVVVDLGFGRGGDFSKYRRHKFARVYAVEPDAAHLAEFHRRHAADLATAGAPRVDVIKARAQDTGAIRRTVGGAHLDAVVSFNVLTFLAQDAETWHGLLATLAELVPIGGKFVGMVQDGHRTRKLLEDGAKQPPATPDGKTRCPACLVPLVADDGEVFCPECEAPGPVIANPTFTVFQVTEFEPVAADEHTFLGDEINITVHDADAIVKNQREWLFYFDRFELALADVGFVLERSQFLDRSGDRAVFDSLPPDSQVFSRLFRDFVFRRTSLAKVGPARGPAVPRPPSPPDAPRPKPIVATLRRWHASALAADRSAAHETLERVHGFLVDQLCPERKRRGKRCAPGGMAAAEAEELARVFIDEILHGEGANKEIFRRLRTMYVDQGLSRPPTGAPPSGGRAASRVKDIAAMLRPSVGRVASYLDVGCNEGGITQAFASHVKAATCVGTDMFLAAGHAPAEKGAAACTYVVNTAAELKFDDSSVDIMTAFVALHHFSDVDAMLGEMRRVLAPGGVLVVREHDCNSRGFHLFLDFVHRLYHHVFEAVPELAPDSSVDAAAYHSIADWVAILGRHGFRTSEPDWRAAARHPSGARVKDRGGNPQTVLSLSAGTRGFDKFRAFYTRFVLDK